MVRFPLSIWTRSDVAPVLVKKAVDVIPGSLYVHQLPVSSIGF